MAHLKNHHGHSIYRRRPPFRQSAIPHFKTTRFRALTKSRKVDECKQCDQIWQFFALWATIQSWW